MFIEHLVEQVLFWGLVYLSEKKKPHALKDLLSGGGMWTTENKQINT